MGCIWYFLFWTHYRIKGLYFKFILHGYWMKIIFTCSLSETSPKIFSISQTPPSTCTRTQNKEKLNSSYMGFFPLYFLFSSLYLPSTFDFHRAKKRTCKSDIDQYQNFLYPISSIVPVSTIGTLFPTQATHWCLCPAPTAIYIRRPTEPIVVNEPFMRAGNTAPVWMYRSATILPQRELRMWHLIKKGTPTMHSERDSITSNVNNLIYAETLTKKYSIEKWIRLQLHCNLFFFQ